MSGPHLVVLGSLNVDLIINVEDLPKSGQTIFSESFIIENGGKGSGIATQIANKLFKYFSEYYQ